MKSITKLALIAAVAATMATNSYALLVSPGAATQVGTGNALSDPGVPAIIAEIQANLGINLTGKEVYKQDAGGSESGSFASSYTTSFSPNAGDASGFKIDYISGSVLSANPLYLLVKDGSNSPVWYLFDITGWNGTDDIDGSGFWPQNGAISHVSIYGTATPPPPSVPDGGTTMLLLGSAVAGLGMLRRKLG